MFNIFKKDNDVVFVGKIDKIKEFQKDGNLAVVLSLADFRDEKIDIYFNNNPQTGNNRADKVKAMNLKEGDTAVVLARVKDDNSATATGFRVLRYGNRLGIGDINIVYGTALVKESKKDNVLGVDIPIKEYVDGQYVDRWYRVAFFDNENRDNATRAKKVFGELTKARVCLVCGKITEKEYNGKTYFNMTGYKVTRID